MENINEKDISESCVNILVIVDDEMELIEKIYFQYFGKKRPEWTFKFSQNEKNALRKIKNTKFVAIVVDMGMTVVENLAFLERLREEGLNIPSIVLTSHGTEDLKARARSLGAVRVLDKPTRLSDILWTICEILERAKPKMPIERGKP